MKKIKTAAAIIFAVVLLAGCAFISEKFASDIPAEDKNSILASYEQA